MTDKQGPKRPTHDLVVKPRDPGVRGGVVGAGWLNEDGSVSVQLNPCVVLSALEVERLTLFPRGRKYAPPAKKEPDAPGDF